MTRSPAFDPTYSRRHLDRNKAKVDAIIHSVAHVDTALDIGCNAGYVSQALLESGRVNLVHGVELDRSVVSETIIADRRFVLHECDVQAFVFDQTYDLIIYASVHHHVVGRYGIEEAFRIWRRIVEHCGTMLVFESGMVAEEGDYYWKDALLNCFPDDRTHFDSLFQAVGPRLKSVRQISAFPIHGISRPVYVLSLWPIGSKNDIRNSPTFYGDHYSDASLWEILRTYRRTIGSQAQRLVSLEDSEISLEHERVYPGAEYYLLRHTQSGDCAFAKRHVLDPFRQMREYHILLSVDHPHVVKPIGVNDRFGLIFRYYPWTPLSDLDVTNIRNSMDFYHDLRDFLSFAERYTVSMGVLAENSHTANRLSRLVDIHPSNILVNVHNDQIVDWMVVDMEFFPLASVDRFKNNQRAILECCHPFHNCSWWHRLRYWFRLHT